MKILRSFSFLTAVVAFAGAGNSSAQPTSSTAVMVSSPEKGWPQFRGPRRDGTSTETGLLAAWPESGPEKIWQVDGLGRGFSSPVIAEGRIFITGDAGDELRIFAFNMDGKPIWQKTNGAAWKESYPGARSTVTYREGRIYHQNAHGRLACLDAADGSELWSVDLLARFGGKNITWGLSECPLVDERAVYATAGGRDAVLAAFDRKTGALLWKSKPLPDSGGDGEPEPASYVSPILVEHGGRRLIAGCSLRHAFVVSAENGGILWTQRFPTTYSVISMMPALVGDSLFITAPHGKGGRLLRIADGTERWSTKLDTLQGCVVQQGGKIIGSFYNSRKSWAAISAETGGLLYDMGDFMKGTPLLADGRIYALAEDGWMFILVAGENSFEVKSKFRFAEAVRRDAWAHPVILDGRLYLRYHDSMTCYDIRAK